MIETKQLQFFTCAAECGSFSEAAKALYTTQSNVSKVISSLEAHLGYPLFTRDPGGIRLTSRGKAFLRKSAMITEALEELEAESVREPGDTVRVASNASSWFARRFSEFYRQTDTETVRFYIHTGSSPEIVNRMRHMEDDLGFLYILPEYKPQFDYDCRRYGLSFETLAYTEGMLYFAPEDHIPEKKPSADIISSMRLVQAEQDSYLQYGNWRLSGSADPLLLPPVSVTTNSDYIMNILIRENGLANISAATFSSYEESREPGWRLERADGVIRYGVLTHGSQPPGKTGHALIQYIRTCIGVPQHE